MYKEELDHLETALELTLPEAYRALMLDHPGFFRQHELCDHADPLVYDNRTLRAEGFFGTNWPKDYLVIGSDGTGNVYFITTAPFDGKVYFADHEGGPGPDDLETAKLHDSLEDYVESLREQHEIVLADIRRTNERIRNRKWWEFWIPTELTPIDDE